MKRAIATIGWWGAPALWVVNMQVGQVAPYADCKTGTSWTSLTTAVALALTLVLAGHAVRTTPRSPGDGFSRWPGACFALIFAFALTLQEFATMMVDPCLR
ncbi:hypothetical protein [Tardiphaga sp.]|jgi:hypothetical protein|uniref:hypothetical protein n=1 Tax=Tardiphaga sp. TaxID=1926292 RepID=UPI0037D9D036